jgi:DNA-binding MarR family transcriptional regulator
MTVAAPARQDEVTTFGLAFKRAMAAVRRVRGRDAQRPGELSYAQYGLLFGLAEHGELCASDLAALAEIAPATATKMLDRLAEHGLVERTRSDRDRRLVLVALTARGVDLVAARRARYEQLWSTALDGFGSGELLAATAVLERVTAMFDELAGDCERPAS